MTAIEIRGLTKRYGDKTAVDHLTLSIKEGELFALLGVNGAGKSTAIGMLSCLTPPTEGDALLLGDSILKDADAIKQKINISPQETAVAMNLSAKENLMLIARLYGVDAKEAAKKADGLIAALALEECAKKRAKTLSGGMRRRLSIAMALITDPRILFLDEPTLGLDVLARRGLWKLIEGLKGKHTIILTTHYMEEAEALSDRIGMMSSGRLQAVGTAAELMERTGTSNFEDAFVALVGEGAVE